MVVVRNSAILALTAAGTLAQASAINRDHDVLANLLARDVTVTVTTTFCPESSAVIPPGYTAPTSSAETSAPTMPAIIPHTSANSFGGAPPTSEATTPASSPAVPVTSTSEVVHTTATPATGSGSGPHTIPVVHTTSSTTTSITSTHTAPASVTVSTPPAVGNAGKLGIDAGALALMVVAALY